MFISIYPRSQVIVYMTNGPLLFSSFEEHGLSNSVQHPLSLQLTECLALCVHVDAGNIETISWANYVQVKTINDLNPKDICFIVL